MSAHTPGASGARRRLHGRSCQLFKPWRPKRLQLLPVIREREFTFVTNNGADFLALLGKEPLHPGILIIVPNVTPILQRELFKGLTTSAHGIWSIVWLRSNTRRPDRMFRIRSSRINGMKGTILFFPEKRHIVRTPSESY